MGHLLMEHRKRADRGDGADPGGRIRRAEDGTDLLRRLPATVRRRTVAGDKGYDTRDFVAGCRELG